MGIIEHIDDIQQTVTLDQATLVREINNRFRQVNRNIAFQRRVQQTLVLLAQTRQFVIDPYLNTRDQPVFSTGVDIIIKTIAFRAPVVGNPVDVEPRIQGIAIPTTPVSNPLVGVGDTAVSVSVDAGEGVLLPDEIFSVYTTNGINNDSLIVTINFQIVELQDDAPDTAEVNHVAALLDLTRSGPGPP
jgi:hypothetical protein